MKQGDLIEVKWMDAWSNSLSYYSSEYDYEALSMKSIGYFCYENDHGIVIADTIQNDARYRGESFYPWEMVRSMEILI